MGTTLQPYILQHFMITNFFLSKSFYYFHNILKVLNFLCIKSQFHILELDYIHKDLSLIYCNLVFIVRCENYYERYIYYEIISGT